MVANVLYNLGVHAGIPITYREELKSTVTTM